MPGAAAKIEETKLYRINGVEVFSAGTWNKRQINVGHLHDMATAFSALKKGFRPSLKLGHDEKQAVARASGLPAIGWVSALYVQGDKLLADFSDIPEKVFRLLKSKAYRKVSSEVYFDLDVSGTKYSAVLGAVALLGAENPGVMNLTDILGQFDYSQSGDVFAFLEKQDTFNQYSQKFELTDEEETLMPENTAELEKQLAAEKKNFELEQEKSKGLAAEKATADAKIAELEKFKTDAEAEKLKLALEAKEAKRSEFVTKLESATLVTPHTKALIQELISDKAEFSIGEGDKAKKYSKEELIEEILKFTVEAAKVNFDESSVAEFAKKQDDKSGAADDADDKEIQKYASDNKCSYQAAYKKVMKNKAK